MAALVNGASLLAIAVWIFVEASRRLGAPPAVQGLGMTAVALGGLAVNLIDLWVLGAGHSESLNVKGAWLHIFADALGSMAALGAGALIWAFGWDWADPVASVLIGALVIYSSWGLLRESVAVLMEGTPAHLNVDAIRDALAGVSGVREVHDLHIWSITTGLVALSAHLVVEEGHPSRPLLCAVQDLLRDRFGIGHTTIQIEPAGLEECETNC